VKKIQFPKYTGKLQKKNRTRAAKAERGADIGKRIVPRTAKVDEFFPFKLINSLT